MGGYLIDLADVLRGEGLDVIEMSGWEFRARSTGPYPSGWPDHVMLHHTASGPGADGKPDADYIAAGASYSPISNLYIERSGRVWVIAGGATNTNGSGNDSWGGGVADDDMNRHAIGIEIGNGGTGEAYPAAQLSAVLAATIACARAYDIHPEHVRAHFEWAPGRKIDPAGPAGNFSGSDSARRWNMDAVRDAVAAGLQQAPGSAKTSGGPPFAPADGEYGSWPTIPNKRVLSTGSRGNDVRYVQGVITNEHGHRLVVDGDFGSKTADGVIALQTAHGLTADGNVGPAETWPVIDRLANRSTTSTRPKRRKRKAKPVRPPSTARAGTGWYYVRPGDSAWSAARRIYGKGKLARRLRPTSPASPGFDEPGHLIEAPGLDGATTEVREAEGPYSILERMGRPASELTRFYQLNGGKNRVLHEGDVVFVEGA